MKALMPSRTPTRAAIIIIGCLIMTLGAAWAVTAQEASIDLGDDDEALLSDDGVRELRLFNEYIAIIVNATDENTGRFAVETTGGDPDRTGDEQSPLIYRIPGQLPWTSYTTVRVDDIDYVFGGPATERAGRAGLIGEQVSPPRIVDDRFIETVYQTGSVLVTQTLSIIRSSTTGLLDTARIEYRVENVGDQTTPVGLRMMLDTMLGANDGAPFRVEELAVTSDTSFTDEHIPDFWQAFDSISDPKVTAQGTLRGDVTVPNRVFFTNWGAVADGVWDFDFSPGRDFTRLGEFQLDSAMVLFWEPEDLAPGESRSYATHYGLGGISISPGQLSIGVTSPATVTAVPEETVTFPVVAYVQNTGEGEARDAVAEIVLPQGLRLASGESQRRNLGHLPSGRTAQVTWTVALDRAVGGDLSYGVRVEAINAEPNEVRRTVTVVSPASLTISLAPKNGRLQIEDGQWRPLPFPVSAVVENTGGADAGGVWVRWDSPIGLELSRGERAEKAVGPLGAGEKVEVEWRVQPSMRPYPFIGNLAYSVNGMITGLPLDFRSDGYLDVPPLDAEIRLQLDEDQDIVGVGDYFLVRVLAQNVRNFYGVDLGVYFDPQALQLVGRSLGVDIGRIFIDQSSAADGDGSRSRLQWSPPQVTQENERTHILIRGDRRGSRQPTLHWVTDTIATLRFRALKEGLHVIGLDEVRVFDENNQGVKADPIDLNVEVVEN